MTIALSAAGVIVHLYTSTGQVRWSNRSYLIERGSGMSSYLMFDQIVVSRLLASFILLQPLSYIIPPTPRINILYIFYPLVT